MKHVLGFDIPESMDALQTGWFVLCRSRELKDKPVQRFLFNRPVVLFRMAGQAKALLDYCPHRGIPLSHGTINGENLRCGYHGWQFNGDGQCVNVPGLVNFSCHTSRDAYALPTHEHAGLIWCCPSPTPSHQKPHTSPYMGQAGYYSFIWETVGEGRLIDIHENFLDGAHTHFVHAGIVRHDNRRQRIKANIKRMTDRVEIEYSQEQKQSGLLSQWLEHERRGSIARFIMPSVAELEYRSLAGPSLLITAYITPTEHDKVHITAIITVPGGLITGWAKRLIATPFFKKILTQDRNILKLQNDQRKYFPEMPFVSTPLDVMRPHIELLMAGRLVTHPIHTQNLSMDF